MGWNDHVDFVEMECLNCGLTGTWECWDDVAKARYTNGLDKFLGHDVTMSDCCPNCGSMNGKPVVTDDDEYWDDCFEEAVSKDD